MTTPEDAAKNISYYGKPCPFQKLLTLDNGCHIAIYDYFDNPTANTVLTQLAKAGYDMVSYSNAGNQVRVMFKKAVRNGN